MLADPCGSHLFPAMLFSLAFALLLTLLMLQSPGKFVVHSAVTIKASNQLARIQRADRRHVVTDHHQVAFHLDLHPPLRTIPSAARSNEDVLPIYLWNWVAYASVSAVAVLGFKAYQNSTAMFATTGSPNSGSQSEQFSPSMVEARQSWRYTGKDRPPFAKVPGPEQESVWDYPRPPRLESVDAEVVVKRKDNRELVCRTKSAMRVCETASPPTYYVPLSDIEPSCGLQMGSRGGSVCEWKGRWYGWNLPGLPGVGWSYPEPWQGFEPLAESVAFYATKVDCWVGDEKVVPQPGGYYGGWILPSRMVGPFKGEPGISG